MIFVIMCCCCFHRRWLTIHADEHLASKIAFSCRVYRLE